MDIIQFTIKTNTNIEELSKKFNLKYGLYCVRGETFSGLYTTGSFKNLLEEIYRLFSLSDSEEQEVTIQALK
jgi:hypothetical protein